MVSTMRHINEERRHRVLSLSTRLEAISAARCDLLRQSEELDAEARSVSVERNTLHNLITPISHIPDEVLAMIFEEGIHLGEHGHRFGVVLSHVSHRWRNVATTTPTLWTYLRLQEQSHNKEEDKYPELLREFTRACVFLSRSRLCPVDIYIEGFEDVSPEFIQLIGEHVGHCRELRTREVGADCLDQLLKCFSSKPIPLLLSIHLDSKHVILLPEQLFPHGAPRLTTVQIDSLDIPNIHRHLAVFPSMTYLRLTGIDIESSNSEEYGCFRDGLMALSSLHHLELAVISKLDAMPHHLPIVLPTLQFLHIDANGSACPESLGPFISVLHAASLVTLSITAWFKSGVEPDLGDGLEHHFPSLEYLILADYFIIWTVDDFDIFARTFPDIERLSIELMAKKDLGIILDAWPKLHTIAISEVEKEFDFCDWHSVVFDSQEAGHPIRRLMLPEATISKAHVGKMVELRKLVVVMECDYADWPTPFVWEDFVD